MLDIEVVGDESCGQKAITYGVLVGQRSRMDSALSKMLEIKKNRGQMSEDKLHCRDLFHPHARAKTAWSRLSQSDVFDLYREVATMIRECGLRTIAAVAMKKCFPTEIPSGVMKDNSGNLGPTTRRVPLGDKQLAAFCAQGALVPIGRDYGKQHIHFWADTDTTPMPWFDGNRQATRAIDPTFIDIGAGQEPPRFGLSQITARERPLLELADFIAYTVQRTACVELTPNGKEFKGLVQILDPTIVRMGIAPDGGLGFQVPDAPLSL